MPSFGQTFLNKVGRCQNIVAGSKRPAIAKTTRAPKLAMRRRRARDVAACAACATAAVAWIVRSLRQSLLHESLETVPLEAHWLLGAVPITQQFYAARRGDAEDPWANHDAVIHASSGSLELRRTRLTRPLRVVSRNPLGMGICQVLTCGLLWLRVQVPRFPTFVSLARPAYLAPAPNGSVHIDHPRRPHAPISCLTTRTPGLREFRRHPNQAQRLFGSGTEYGFVAPRAGTRPLNTWTLEVVVLFLPSRHFGRTWQTVRARKAARQSEG